ncbi:hypothetical protein [Vibrio nomapromontoriensis]
MMNRNITIKTIALPRECMKRQWMHIALFSASPASMSDTNKL